MVVYELYQLKKGVTKQKNESESNGSSCFDVEKRKAKQY